MSPFFLSACEVVSTPAPAFSNCVLELSAACRCSASAKSLRTSRSSASSAGVFILCTGTVVGKLFLSSAAFVVAGCSLAFLSAANRSSSICRAASSLAFSSDATRSSSAICAACGSSAKACQGASGITGGPVHGAACEDASGATAEFLKTLNLCA
eukprot:CAMPEP_0169252382 /NCGR_PEP_ID=MMETSP1016-20121227/38021_1 /TAXON_ID=342587 /ORGANISM="Karlodinium micrum, Strain CCMP2283" /LENGTH=154 /DNA_ID=CAMNT_0009333591 /DNA_START=199 /DNA_END=663 /DNA_ORIENTATION=+